MNTNTSDELQKRIIEILDNTPELKEVIEKLNSNDVNWAIAAGVAYYIYTGLDPDLSDVDIFVDSKDKEKISKLYNFRWEHHSSEKHEADNLEFGKVDFFTDIIKKSGEKTVLNYVWSKKLQKHLRLVKIEEVVYKILSPEDVALLKMVNPRSEHELEQVDNLLKDADEDYLEERKIECKYSWNI